MKANPVVEVRQADKRRVNRRVRMCHHRTILSAIGPVATICKMFPQYAAEILRAQSGAKPEPRTACSARVYVRYFPKTNSVNVLANSEDAARDDPRFQRFMQAAMSGPDLLAAEV